MTETIAQQRFNESPGQTKQIYSFSLYDFPYSEAIGEDMNAFLADETLHFLRVGIMFGLHSCVREDLVFPYQGVTRHAINDKPTELLQWLVLGISGTVVGLQEFMATSLAPICETLLSAGANPNSRWAGHDGGTLWTHLLFYYATRIEDNRGIPDIATMEAFVKNGADLTACVDFRGTRYAPNGLVRSLLTDFPKFADELTRLLEQIDARTTKLPHVQITISPPIEQACALPLSSISKFATSYVADASQGGNPPSDSSDIRRSLGSSETAISRSLGEDTEYTMSRKERLLRKIFRGQ